MIKLLLTTSFPPYRGGISHYLYETFKNYPLKKELVVITQTPEFVQPEEDLSIFKDVVRSKYLPLKGKFYRLDFYFKILKFFILNFKRIDYIYTESLIPTTIFSYLYKIFSPSTKIVTFAYGTDINIIDPYIKRKRRFVCILKKFLLNRVDRIITISSYTERILKRITKKDVRIISPKYSKERFKEKKHTRKDKIKIITVAQLTPRKGHLYVLKSLSLLKEKIDFVYYIVGSGWFKDVIEKKIEDYGLKDRAFIKTDLKNFEVVNLYKESDIFILTPYYYRGDFEGFGIVYLEAGAFKLPIIATGSGGSGDILIDGFNAVIVKEKDYIELSEEIYNLSTDHIKREILSENGFKMSFYKKGDCNELIF